MTHHSEHDVESDLHRASCAECQALWTELEAIGAEAARLPLLTPSRDDAAEIGSTEAGEMHLAAFSASVTQMDREIATLQTIVSERRGELDPKTIEVLERNLALIDTAITEARAALDADPASQFLAQQFTRAYTSKLTLLRGAAQLPAGL